MDAAADALARDLVSAIQRLADQGLTPATSSNFSARNAQDGFWITISGRDKTRIGPADLMAIDAVGGSVKPGLRPSAETALHLQIYQQFPSTQAVLHSHSRVQTVASRLYAEAGAVRLAGYELLKALPGQSSHASEVLLPVVANSQDMAEIQAQVAGAWSKGLGEVGYLIDGHGLYTWGDSIADALRHLEALEFLLVCELDLRRLQS